MSQQEMISLLDRYLAGEATLQEQETVETWLDGNEDLNNEWQRMDGIQRNQFLTTLYQRIQGTIANEGNGAQVRHLRLRRRWIGWVAAAVIIGIIALAVVGVLTNNRRTASRPTATTHDVAAPKETRAVITLANGSKVYLDSVDNGTIAQESNVNVVKTEDGKLIYNPSSQQLTAKSLAYNTLFNPRGSKVIDMTLSDGSHVWLNSGSSIKYPVAFIGSERIVEITGEAYFEVKHDASKPFIVTKGETSVTVLGTHFNVNAYDDEDALKVTLLEGSVKVANRVGSVNIKPGQQAAVSFNLQPLTFNNIDLEEVMSWKNGRFDFKGADLQAVMRQVARWYDVDVVYQDNVNEKFFAEIPRETKASDVLKALELTGKVHFKIEGKKIIVTK